MIENEATEKRETPIDIQEFFYPLRSWAWLILLVGALAGAVVFFISSRTIPQYQTSTRLLISDPPVTRSLDTNAMISGQTLIGTYAEMLVDAPVLQGVIDKLGLPLTIEQLSPTITVEIVRNTQLLLVTVQNQDPQLAVDIANTIAQVFTERIRELQSQRYAASQKGLAQQVTDMEKQINDTTDAIAQEFDPAQKLQFEARLTEYRRLYASLVTNFEQVRLAEAQTSTNVFVSAPARISTVPVSPKTTRDTLLAIVAGLLLATGAVFAVHTLDDTIKNPDEIRAKFNLPVLGMIAMHKIKEGQPVCQAEPRSPVAESFRSLRTNITYAAVDGPLRRILITSPTPQDGKTTISSNLAVILAQGEKRVVLIDADLRRPQIHHKFGLFNRIGLSDLFVPPNDSLDGALQTCDVPRLSVITSGRMPPNPAELLTSNKMLQIFVSLSENHDLVIVDTPPLLSVTDAAALSTNVDGVILVIKPGVTKSGALTLALSQLNAVRARVLGVVLNGVDPASRKYGYYYDRYYSKYSHYYDVDGEKKRDGTRKDKKSGKEKESVKGEIL